MLTNHAQEHSWSDLGRLVDRGHRYKRAPIIEAILELRVEPREQPLADVLSSIQRMLSEAPMYQAGLERFQFETGLIADSQGIQTTGKRTHIGYEFRRLDNQRVIFGHLDRFVFSWLKPYSEWTDFVTEAEAIWLLYRQAVGVEKVVSAGVRFVNRIDVPSAGIEIKDYLRTSVDISPYLPQSISSLFLQVGVPMESHNAVATITSTIVSPPDPGITSLILDIDTVTELDLATETDGFDNTLSQTLETLRDAKNLVFEACITDGTRGLIS